MDWTALMDLHGAYERSRVLHAAIAHDLFTHVATLEGQSGGLPVPGTAVAAAAGTDPRATELVLNALASLGLLQKSAPEDPETPMLAGGFNTAPVAQRHLVDGCDADFRPFIRFDMESWTQWELLPDVLEEGGPAMQDHMFQSDPEATRRFIDAMESIGQARGDAKVLADRIDIGRAVHLLDVGGGAATYSLAFLAANKHLHATLIDLPNTLEVTKDHIAKAPLGVRERIRIVACDYNTDDIPRPPKTSSLPDALVKDLKKLGMDDTLLPKLSEGYDIAWVSNILHGEDEEANKALARKLFAVLRPGGRVIIKDHILDPTLTEPQVGALFAVNMLLFTKGGRSYGLDEVRRWYEDAGFVDITEEPPRAPLTSSLVTARKPGGGLQEELSRAMKLAGENVSGFVRSLTGRSG